MWQKEHVEEVILDTTDDGVSSTVKLKVIQNGNWAKHTQTAVRGEGMKKSQPRWMESMLQRQLTP